jgi:aromatic ring-opening dioxygenase LigB subunit
MSRLALIALLLLAGCTTAYQYVAVPPHLMPLQAELPVIYAAELECLSDATYTRLVEREQEIRFELDQYRALLGARGLPRTRP